VLTRADLDRFLRTLARRLPCPATVVITGGCEAMLLGGARPTGDVDFELRLARRHAGSGPAVEAAVAEAAARASVAVQWSTDVDRWSLVSVPSRHRRARRFRTIGRLRVDLLDPACWAVYKLARYLEPDVEDLVAVLRRERVGPRRLARLCGEALRASPRSTALFLFRRQVEAFFRTHGASIWPDIDGERAVAAFHRAAGIARR
jgi:hypothetical protein